MQTIEERGRNIYDERLRTHLEQRHLGEAVAIHLASGDYATDKRWAIALRRLRERHPDGETYTQFIGPPTPDEMALANRLGGGVKQ